MGEPNNALFSLHCSPFCHKRGTKFPGTGGVLLGKRNAVGLPHYWVILSDPEKLLPGGGLDTGSILPSLSAPIRRR